jgi:hypothetical protein
MLAPLLGELSLRDWQHDLGYERVRIGSLSDHRQFFAKFEAAQEVAVRGDVPAVVET